MTGKPSLVDEIEALVPLHLEGLREIWRDRFGAPPKLRSAELLRHCLAWRLQAEALGGLDGDTRRRLKRRQRLRAEGLDLGIGTTLQREWRGRIVQDYCRRRGLSPRGTTLQEPLRGGNRDRGHALEWSAFLRPPIRQMSQPRLHCALYTRKSTEEGLEQAFNTLDAQREACEAYVKSQAGEGWRAVRSRYDDGGFSGASMERPALKRLLCDIEAGKVDVVVVYKIDRLTRSLPDFARMIEIFDRRRASFVSVTQAFNTTTSMGRLTLNVLLSFAQFEREVTGERIRDKIAASKAKGMWMGGTVPLGYDPPVEGRHVLRINRAEAEIVRTIFRAYIDLGSVHALQRWLEDRGIRSKRRTTRAGRLSGGGPFSRGALFQLLRNRLYLGMIVHKGRVHPGRHQAIIDADWTLLTKVETSCDRILIAGGANVEAEWEQGPAV